MIQNLDIRCHCRSQPIEHDRYAQTSPSEFPAGMGALGGVDSSWEPMENVYRAEARESCATCTRGSIAVVTDSDLFSRTRLRLAVSRLSSGSEPLADVYIQQWMRGCGGKVISEASRGEFSEIFGGTWERSERPVLSNAYRDCACLPAMLMFQM